MLLPLLATLALAQDCPQPLDFLDEPTPHSALSAVDDAVRFVELGGSFYFAADTLDTGSELFRTDGTAAGTQLVAELVPGGLGSAPAELFAHQGFL